MGISDKIPEEHSSSVIIHKPRSVSEVLAIWAVAVGSNPVLMLTAVKSAWFADIQEFSWEGI